MNDTSQWFLHNVKEKLDELSSQMGTIEKATKKKNTITKAVAIGVALTLILVIIITVVELTQIKSPEILSCDDLPKRFSSRYMSRAQWFSRASKQPLEIFPQQPLSRVILDTEPNFSCDDHVHCPNVVLEMQTRDQAIRLDDIAPNFILVEDGYIYEGRGWDKVGQLVPDYDAIALEVLILGNFEKTFPRCSNTTLFLLLEEGLRLGKLSRDFRINLKYQFVADGSMKFDSPLGIDMRSWRRWSPDLFRQPKKWTVH